MVHKTIRSSTFWLGALALVATAIVATMLVGTPMAQAEPLAAPSLQGGYPSPIDLIADKIEVTQGAQDLANSVRLVANKRTFVRFYAHSSGATQTTTALLEVQRADGSLRFLNPLNPGQLINVVASPDRAALHQAFLFELPSGFRSGAVTLTARVNPIGNRPAGEPFANNRIQTNVAFESVPPVNVVLYRVSYNIGATTYTPAANDATQMASWLRRAYPLADLRVWFRTSNWGAGSAAGGSLNSPNCGTLNNSLFVTRIFDVIFGWGAVPSAAHYYGLVSDGGGFMRGCAMNIPAFVASGPAGSATWGWDFDGTYADWYGGHELAHTYGRFHAMYCGAGGGVAYPYPGGRISPVLTGNGAIYGFDIGNQVVYPPTWNDVMTYCSNQWISDFTYEGLMDYFKTHPVSAAAVMEPAQAADRLLVSGVIDPATGVTQLDPIYLLPNVEDTLPRQPGDYAIVLLGANNQELARYPFTPRPSDGGPVIDPTDSREVQYLIITELVENVAGTQAVVVEGPGGAKIAQVAPGTNKPTVQFTAPAPGATLAGDTIHLAWTGADVDGDPLRYKVQFSADNGVTWGLVAQNLTETSIDIPRTNLIGSTQALFRVWVSDGLNTASADLAGTVTIPASAPQVQILAPAADSSFVLSETVGLVGSGYNVDTGPLSGAQLEWLSDRDGLLGTGENLSLATLSVGTHIITLRTPDGHGGFVETTTTLTVGVISALVADGLVVGPTAVVLAPSQSVASADLAIDNRNAIQSIGWTAASSEGWLALGAVTGVTPAQIKASYVGQLPTGSYNAEVTFTSTATPGQQVKVPVHITVADFSIYLPATRR